MKERRVLKRSTSMSSYVDKKMFGDIIIFDQFMIFITLIIVESYEPSN